MDLGAVGRVLLLSALPISELRGGLPLALALGFPPAAAYALAVAGNLLPVPFLLLGLDGIVRLARALPGPLGRAAGRYLAWQERRSQARFRRWGPWALLLFVAIPLPMTGAWTGCLAAFLLGIPLRRSLPRIALGVLLAGGIVLAASLGLIAVL
ncbi:MAG: small multi-drug export protein [Candidatus Bipolaricaulota bacterium]|nr:small multi-drug export protein [Candidatus Bipolaricaulota bacterium]